MNMDLLAKTIHHQNKQVGWWDDPNRCLFEVLQLVSTEIAEATEGERKNLTDDHLPSLPMAEVELADALIRMLDLAGNQGWKHHEKVGIMSDLRNVKSIAGQHLILNMCLSDIARMLLEGDSKRDIERFYSLFVNSVLYIGRRRNFNVERTLYKKMRYNETRADHKRENRAKEHGKKF